MVGAGTAIAERIASGLFNTPLPEVTPDVWGRPFTWMDPASLPPRRFLYPPHLIRGFVSLTVSPGGVGKSTLALGEALSVASGKPLLGVAPSERARAWVWNGEDPMDEIERRIHGAMVCHNLKADDLEGWLFLGSGREADLLIAEQRLGGAITVNAPVVDAIVAFIRAHEIGLLSIDPFVSCHQVPENDNGAINRVAKAWARVAEETGCAVELVHHTRKTGGQEVTVEDGRGASALLAAARHGRTLRRMTIEEADRYGVERADRWSFIRAEDGKANLSPMNDRGDWYRLIGIDLPNGDTVQAARAWSPPNPYEPLSAEDLRKIHAAIAAGRPGSGEPWRANIQAGDAWVGNAVASALALDPYARRDIQRIKNLINDLRSSGLLAVVERAINPKGKRAPFVEVGRALSAAT